MGLPRLFLELYEPEWHGHISQFCWGPSGFLSQVIAFLSLSFFLQDMGLIHPGSWDYGSETRDMGQHWHLVYSLLNPALQEGHANTVV